MPALKNGDYDIKIKIGNIGYTSFVQFQKEAKIIIKTEIDC